MQQTLEKPETQPLEGGGAIEDRTPIRNLYPERDAQGPYRLERDLISWYKKRPPDITVIAGLNFLHVVKKDDAALCTITLHEIDQAIKAKYEKAMLNDTKELRRKAIELIPPEYHDYLDVFSKTI